MAIDFSKTKRVVFFEIDRISPHDLGRFHRTISQAIAEIKITPDDFEEVIGSYNGVMNVAYCMSLTGFNHIFDRIEFYFRDQEELYDYDLENFELVSYHYDRRVDEWRQLKLDWAAGHAVGSDQPTGEGWTYFPSSRTFFTILSKEQADV